MALIVRVNRVHIGMEIVHRSKRARESSEAKPWLVALSRELARAASSHIFCEAALWVCKARVGFPKRCTVRCEVDPHGITKYSCKSRLERAESGLGQ